MRNCRIFLGLAVFLAGCNLQKELPLKPMPVRLMGEARVGDVKHLKADALPEPAGQLGSQHCAEATYGPYNAVVCDMPSQQTAFEMAQRYPVTPGEAKGHRGRRFFIVKANVDNSQLAKALGELMSAAGEF